MMGCSLILLGLAKKILISDYLAIYVNKGFDPGNSGIEFLNFNSLSTFLVIGFYFSNISRFFFLYKYSQRHRESIEYQTCKELQLSIFVKRLS